MSLFCIARWLRSAISRRMRADFAEIGAGGGVGAAVFIEVASTRLVDFGLVTLEGLDAFATGLAATILLFASTGDGERLLTGADGLAVNDLTERLETARVAEVADFFSPDFVTSLRAELLGEPEEAAGLLAFALAVDCLGPATGFDTAIGFDTAAAFVAAAGFIAVCFIAVCFVAVGFVAVGFVAAGFVAAGFVAAGFDTTDFAAACLAEAVALTAALGPGVALLLAADF